LRYLVDSPEHGASGFHAADIDLAWVRGIGPYGGVMLRFDATASTLEALKDRRNIDCLERALNRGVSHGEKAMRARVVSADARWDAEVGKTHRTYKRIGRISGRQDGERLQRMLAILASDPKIDIASYDRVIGAGDEYVEGWRVYDLGGRGKFWLDDAMEQANLLCGTSRGKKPIEKIETYQAKDFEQIARATVQLTEWSPRREDRQYIYFRVQVVDRRGLFARVLHFARTAPGKDGLPADREVVRSCCRGIGGQGMNIVAVRGRKEDAPILQASLQQILEQEHGVANGTYRERVIAVASSSLPTAVSVGRGRTILLTIFDAVENHPGLLRVICDAAVAVRAAKASVYYLGARTKPNYHSAKRGESCLSCAIGWVLEKQWLVPFQLNIDERLATVCSKKRPPIYFPALPD
jgi:hypothetical protein